MRVAAIRVVGVLFTALLAACGGGAGASGGAKTGGASGASGDVSIGDLASSQGGLTSLGGGDNAAVPDTGYAGALKADIVLPGSPVKLDGVLKEWPARVAAKTVVSGKPARLAFACAVQYDAHHVYFAGDANDPQFYRTSHFGADEDHASLILAVPGAGGALVATEVGFFAGKPGEYAGVVRYLSGQMKGKEVPGSKIVEAPTAHGYSFEASVPWSTFPGTQTVRVGLHGVGRYYDGTSAVVATGAGDVHHAADMPALETEPEQSLVESFLVPKGLLAATPRADVYADITGDAMKERITVFDRFVTIVGPGYRGGKEFFFRDLGADLVHLDARPITGRGKDNLLFRVRFDGEDQREWVEVWSFLSGAEPTTTFTHEILVSQGSNQVANSVHLGHKTIEVGYEPAKGWTAATYQRPVATDVEPVLLPWGPTRSQLFRFDGSKFRKVKEVAQKATGPAPTGSVSVGHRPTIRRVEPPTPVVHHDTNLSKELLARYRADRGVPASVKSRFDMSVQLTGDPRPERVVLVGRDVVVFGPGFKGGTAYAYITLSQFADPADIQDIHARDLTGDGDADLVVRGLRHVTAAGSGKIDMDVLFVYQVKSDSLARIFGIETGRQQGRKRIQGMVQFIPGPGGKGFTVDVRPGRAVGWTEKTYPWAQDPPGAGPLEPLLLPWGSPNHLQYTYNGSAFAQSP